MKRLHNLLTIITLCLLTLLSTPLLGQSYQSKLEVHKFAKQFTLTDITGTQSNLQLVAEQLNTNPDNFIQKQEFKSESGTSHIRYSQTHNSIPVIGGDMIIHQPISKAATVTANFLPHININTQPSLDQAAVFNLALIKSQAESYIWDVDPTYAKPSPQLCVVDKSFPSYSGDYALAYSIDIYSVQPLSQERHYIDAHTGSLIATEPLMCTESVPATGKTLYLGEQTFVADSVSSDLYQLIDHSRGQGNTTYTHDGDNRVVLTDEDNYWDYSAIHNRNAAIDAHYCTGRFFDLLVEHFDYSGIDGEGGSMDCVVNFRNGDAYVNAFWDGRFAWFGDGDCTRGPLTSVDVVAHEFMHGVTDYTSDLIYMDESGALNESMSDIFGKALEFYVTPNNFNWLIGQTFILNNEERPFRNMADPNLEGHPKFYDGTMWFEGEGDNGGVHINSGVLNYWFHLLVEGGQGETEKGVPFDITGLGMDKAIQIPFLMQRAYLTRTSTYSDAYNGALAAAIDIYGDGSEEYETVVKAMNAIGLPVGSNIPVDLDLSIVLNTEISNTCTQGEKLDLEVTVTNVGQDTLYAQDTIIVIVNDNAAQAFNFIQEEDFVPGADTTIILSEAYTIIAEGDLRIRVDLGKIDKVAGNNTDRVDFFNYFEQSDDLKLTVFVPSAIECFERDIPIEVVVSNSSCDPIPAGTDITIHMMTGNEVIQEYTETLEDGLPVGGNVRTTMPYTYPGNVTILDFELIVAEDSNPTNNEVNFLPVFKEESLQTEYFNPLDTRDDFTRFITLNEDFYFGVVNYDGETYMGTTGQSNSIDDICQFWQDNFITNATAIMEMCVDMADFENVVLSFDLVQLRNSQIEMFPDRVEEFTMVEMRWTDENNNETLLINNQPDGEIVHYDIPLPDHFTGFITFEFYSHFGNLSFSSNNALENNDYNLLNDLNITGDFVSDVDDIVEQINKISVYPNPTHQYIELSGDNLSNANLSVYNAQGRLVLTQILNNQNYKVDVSQFDNGLYFIQTLDQNNAISTARFIKSE